MQNKKSIHTRIKVKETNVLAQISTQLTNLFLDDTLEYNKINTIYNNKIIVQISYFPTYFNICNVPIDLII